jgi:N-formylglutamate amidohydrolase
MKDTTEAPFRVVRPRRPSPLVFAAAHAGRLYPAGARSALQASEATLRSLEDPLVDQLIAGATTFGVATIVCDVARAYVDVNRDPAEIDPALLDDERQGRETPRTRAGLGVVPRLGGDAKALHRTRLSPGEIEHRIMTVHRPYHAALADLMREAREAFGLALLIDWHSMPSAAAITEARRGGKRPEIVIGDRHGQSTDADLSGALRAAFEGLGRRVVMNRPFAGGYTTQAWGRPAEGLHALQIEIDRSLYLDETTLEPGAGFDALRAEVGPIAERLLAVLETKKAAPESAA